MRPFDKAKDKKAKDAGNPDDKVDAGDPEKTNDEEMDDMEGEDEFPESPEGGMKKPAKDKKGMDAVDARVARALAARDALHTARREVEPVIGVVGFDSAGDVYRAALAKLGVDAKGIHDSALPALLKLAKDRAAPPAPLAADSGAAVDMVKAIPGLNRVRAR